MEYNNNFEILKAILVKLGGDEHVESNFEALLAILNNMGGGSEEIVVDLPATISEDGTIDIQATVEEGIIELNIVL